MDYYKRSMLLHEALRGKIRISGKAEVETLEDLATIYTPGVAEPCRAIAADPSKLRELTIKRNSVAVITDGSAVLGLGNIGPEAALPVMEGKALLFREYGAVDAWPLCLATQDVDDIVHTVRMIAPAFGGINLEDISAPRCFHVEEQLQDLGIPVFHDDQHGTAIVVLAALTNACRVLGKDPHTLRVVIAGAGAAGTAIARMLIRKGHETNIDCICVGEVVVCDSKGAIYPGREGLNAEKEKHLMHTNKDHRQGSLKDILKGADVFIGVSRPGVINAQDVKTMAPQPMVFALSNPEPEIHPEEAAKGGAVIIATGRSDFPNQTNNVLVFPGIFRGALDAGASRITDKMKLAAVNALADAVRAPERNFILPHPLDRSIAHIVGDAVRKAAMEK